MKVGLFDHFERAEDRPFATQFDERLAFAQAADEAGFYCLHIAEHHSSPLNMVPEPGVWLGALAHATRRIHLGPLVYLLPVYSPLRLAEEICLLDHLSKGRMEIGVGRGVSPFETAYHGVDHAKSREIFFDAYDCLITALTNDTFSYDGKYFSYKDVPMPMRPLQQPYPAIWYGSSGPEGSTWAGENGLHFVANGQTEVAGANIATFKEALAKRGSVAHPKAEFEGGAAAGVLRHVVVADTDEEAKRIAKPAIEHHVASLNWMRRHHGITEFTDRQHVNVHRGVDFESWEKMEMAVAGNPDTVTKELTRQAGVLGINYLIVYLFFGTMALADALRSQHLFATEVMPALAEL